MLGKYRRHKQRFKIAVAIPSLPGIGPAIIAQRVFTAIVGDTNQHRRVRATLD